MSLKLILFDLDGTLTDPLVGIRNSMVHALSRMDCPYRGDVTRFIGPPLREVFSTLLETDDPAQIERAVACYREYFGSVGLFENRVFAGVPEMLQALRERGLRLCVATSKARVYAERIVDHFELGGYFEAVYGPELDGRMSEKAALIAHALERQRVGAGDSCMIGDRRHDIAGAGAHGLRSIGVTWGFGSEAELREAGADRVVDAVAALPGAITALEES